MVQENSLKKTKLIAIIGPTASGKTSLAVRLAKKYNGEIISADSMQIYTGLDIGTAKVTEEEKEGVPHYMLDVVNPGERFTVADWKECAENKIQEISSRGKLPIIAGGTGLYISSLLYGYDFYNAKEDFCAREMYTKILKEKGADYLYNLLLEKSPELAKKVDKNKTHQLIRYLEIAQAMGTLKPKSSLGEGKYEYLLLGLDVDRIALYERINARVDIMINKGLEEEVRGLIERGVDLSSQGALAIGYKEIIDYLHGETTKERAVELIKQHSRNYAKRQLTWMKRMKNLVWVNPQECAQIDKLVQGFLKGEKNE